MRNHLKRFLLAYPCFRNSLTGQFPRSFDELPEIAFDDSCTFLGKFSKYIEGPDTPKVKKWNPHKQIISACHVVIVAKFPMKECTMASHYTTLLKNIQQLYLNKHEVLNTPMVDNTVLIDDRDYEYHLKVMFKRGLYQELCMATGEMHSAGRISEV